MKNKLFIYAVFAALLFAACKNDPEAENPPAPKTVHVQDISIKNPINPVSLVKGTTSLIAAEVLPKNADNKKISYTSSNKTLVSVSANGLISAENIGTATITLKAENISKMITVTVTAARVNVTGIAVASTDENVSIVKGSTHQLSAAVKPENATNKTLTYSSDHDDIASIDTNGLISAKKVGTASVTIHAENNITKTITVTVTAARVNVAGIDVSSADENVSIVKGGTHKLSATVKPENATNKTLTYSSDHDDIASVDTNGLISAKTAGTASVTIHAADSITKTISVTVTEAEIPVTDIEFDPPLPAGPLELTIGQEYKFGAKAMPDNATNKNLKFTTSDSSTAWLFGDGNSSVRGEKEGTATVTIESESNPGVKKIVTLKIKPKPSIKIKTNPEMCESGGGNVSFTMETLNGKLGYTPEVTGGGAKWLNIAGKDSTDETTDTVRLSVSENKTPWERTAYIKFKDADGKYIKRDTKGSNGKYDDMQVKLTQKKNDNPEVTIKWVYGITEPADGEKHKIEIPNTYPKESHKQSYVFTWDETMTTTFFNTRKLTHTGAPYGALSDSNQCWAKTDANMLHWWFEQNKDNINHYKIKKNLTGDAAKPYEPFYTRGLADNMEHEKSSIANLYREKFINKGGNPANGLQWYLFGFDGLKNARPNTSSPALFKDVFNEANSPIKQPTIYTKKEFEDTIKDALDSKKAVGLNRYGTNTSQHAITLWGAAFDKDNNIVAIYVVDNNEKPNRVFPYGIWYQKGVDIYADSEPVPDQNNPHFYNPYFINYSSNTYDSSHYIGEITTLDKGEEQWQKWRAENP